MTKRLTLPTDPVSVEAVTECYGPALRMPVASSRGPTDTGSVETGVEPGGSVAFSRGPTDAGSVETGVEPGGS